MQQASIKFSGRGPLFLYPAERRVPRRVSRRILNGSRATQKSYCFSTTTRQADLRRKRLSVLSPGKVFIGFVEGYKDASDALQADDLKAITRAVWDAKPYRPDGIVDGKSLLDLVTTPNPPNDYEYPYSGLNQVLNGVRFGELVTITAGSGIGKSSFCRELATHFYKMEDGSVTWLLKNQTDVLLWA